MIVARRSVVVLLLALSFVGCGKKSGDSANGGTPTAELTGLAAVPASAGVVIGLDVSKLSQSPLVGRAIDQLLQRDPELAARWQRLKDSCKIDLATQIKRVMLAIGPAPAATGKPGTGPTIVIATGTIAENDLSTCVRAMVGQGGGSLSAKEIDGGRTLYEAKDGNRTMFFAFGRPDTVVLGANEAFVTEALGAGKKVGDEPEMKSIIGLADQTAPLWAAGKVDDRIRQGLVGVTNGKLSGGPKAFIAALDPTEGAKVSLGAVMPTPADANTLESFAKNELGTLAMVAQMKGLQRVVDKIEVKTDNAIVRFTAALSTDDVNQLLSALDGNPAPAQGSAAP